MVRQLTDTSRYVLARGLAAVTEIDANLAASLSRRFRLTRQFGQGGMGAVFIAEQIAVGNRPVAL